MKHKLLYLFSILIFVFACASDDPEAVDEAFDYIQLTQGSWYEYALDSTIYDDFDNSVVTRSYDLRVEIDDTFLQNGLETTRMLRYIRPSGSEEEFELETVWFATINNNRLETVEENLRFIKFIFPPFEGLTWEGNVFIAGEGNDNPTTSTRFYEGWNYEVISADQPETVQGTTFDQVAHISQVDEPGGPGAIQHLVSDEYYARGVGLIKKRLELVVENCGTPGCSDKSLAVLDRENLRKGYILNLELTDYQIQ